MSDPNNGPDPAELHHALVDDLLERQLITSPDVEAAFRAVPRAPFLPGLPPEEVYADRAIPTKQGADGRPLSSSSQPAIMAIMLEQLALAPGQRVLEIGAGTGYNAALIAHIVGEAGQVTSVDIDQELVDGARAHLAAAGFDRVQVVGADGMFGYEAHAPYDRILLTVAAWDIPPEWLAQLRADGRLVLPFSFGGPQLSVAFERDGAGLASRSVTPCGFVPVRGPRADPSPRIEIGTPPALALVHASAPLDPDTLASWLRAPYAELDGGIELTRRELLFHWALWAFLYLPGHVMIDLAEGEAARLPVPDLLPPFGVNFGLLAPGGLALLATPGDAGAPDGESAFTRSHPFRIRSYGPDKTVGARLQAQLRAWDSAGRPPAGQMTVTAHPSDAGPDAGSGDGCVTRRWHRFCVRWAGPDGA